MKLNKIVKVDGDYYEITNEKINVGDWFIWSDDINYIFKCIGHTEGTHLQVSNDDVFGGYDADNGSDYGDWAICYSYKIVASTKVIDGVKLMNIPTDKDSDKVVITDEQLNELLDELEEYGCSVDEYCYGLPIYEHHIVNMRNIIRNKLIK